MVTQEQLKELLSYDQDTGVFIWRVYRRGKALAGTVAGRVRADGGRVISVNDRSYHAHRLAWLYVYGRHPNGEVDHKDGNRDNNAIVNLREASRSQNAANSKKSNCSNQLKGVLEIKGRNLSKPFKVQMTVERRQIYIGYFSTAEEAHNAYFKAAQKHFGEFARAR